MRIGLAILLGVAILVMGLYIVRPKLDDDLDVSENKTLSQPSDQKTDLVDQVMSDPSIPSAQLERVLLEEDKEKFHGIRVIPLQTSLILSGAIEANEMIEPDIVILLDQQSTQKLPSEAQPTSSFKYMQFDEKNVFINEVATHLLPGTRVTFTISEYISDTRGTEAYDSGTLTKFEIAP